MNRRPEPIVKSSRLIPALLAVAIVAAGFTTLMVRLEVTQEGYRLSALRLDIRNLEDSNQRLKLQSAELSSHARLRMLAAKYKLRPAAPDRVVMMP
jgi:cell division protein FtsL